MTKSTGEERAVLISLDDTDRQHNLDPWSIYIDALEPHYGSRAEAEKVAFGYAAEAVLGNDTKSTPSFETPTELKAANHD